MATATQVPLDIYMSTAFEPDADYVDGQIEKRPMGIPTVMLIKPETKRILQYRSGELNALTSTIHQLSGSRCFIDWDKVEELLD